MKVIVLPVEEADTLVVGVVNVPLPSPADTLVVGVVNVPLPPPEAVTVIDADGALPRDPTACTVWAPTESPAGMVRASVVVPVAKGTVPVPTWAPGQGAIVVSRQYVTPSWSKK
jgi:hypothetical protein